MNPPTLTDEIVLTDAVTKAFLQADYWRSEAKAAKAAAMSTKSDLERITTLYKLAKVEIARLGGDPEFGKWRKKR